MSIARAIVFSPVIVALLAVACSDDHHAVPALDARADRGSPDSTALDRGAERGADHAQDTVGIPDAAVDVGCADPGVTLAGGVHLFPTNVSAGQPLTLTYPASGRLGGRDNLTLHYGFNFWDLDLGGAVFRELAMRPLGDGSFTASIDVPVGARLLDFVFYSESGGEKTWDNNNQADYHRGLGVPYVGPYLTFVDNTGQGGATRDPAHSITVSFKSDRACRGAVRYGRGVDLGDGQVEESAAARVHHLRLEGLSPDTDYYYRVSCVDEQATCPVPETSPTYSFRSAPQSATRFRFFFIGDPQDNRHDADRWKDIAAAMARRSPAEARFVVIAGDLVGDDYPERWWDFFDKGRALFASRALVPAVGNHDTPTSSSSGDTSSFEEHFFFDSSSGKQTYYALSYGNATFLVLNSETAQSWASGADWAPGGAQYEWVKAKLATLQSEWGFAVWHIPPYDAGTRHMSQNASTRGITALFDGKLDWVLCGHEHLYQRSKPLRYQASSGGAVVARYGRGVDEGVGYLIAPAAGHDAPSGTLAVSDPIMAVVDHPPDSEIVDGSIVPWVGHVEIAIDDRRFDLATYALGESQARDTLTYSRP